MRRVLITGAVSIIQVFGLKILKLRIIEQIYDIHPDKIIDNVVVVARCFALYTYEMCPDLNTKQNIL